MLLALLLAIFLVTGLVGRYGWRDTGVANGPKDL